MEYSKGIPDDTPENAARAIREILHEEAEKFGWEITVDEEKTKGDNQNLRVEVSNTQELWFTLSLIYVDSLHTAFGSAQGRGFITWGDHTTQGNYYLQLLPNDTKTLHKSPPFIWAVYGNEDEIYKVHPPTALFHLDGLKLRELLRESLGLSEPIA